MAEKGSQYTNRELHTQTRLSLIPDYTGGLPTSCLSSISPEVSLSLGSEILGDPVVDPDEAWEHSGDEPLLAGEALLGDVSDAVS